MRKDASAEEEKTLAEELGFVGATFYHVGPERIESWGSESEDFFEAGLAKCVTPEVKSVIVDLERVEFMSEAAIRALFVLQAKLKKVNPDNKVVLLDVSDPVKDKLEMGGFLENFSQGSSK